MRSASIGKITTSVSSNRKKSKFNLSHDVNTTYDWGSVQPLLSRFMLPDSSINVNMEQLTRLSPMVVPTFGRVKLKNVVHFVSVRDIFPNWDYFLSQTSINRPVGSSDYEFVPSVIPHVNSSILTAMCLAGARASLFVSGDVGTNQEEAWICYRNLHTSEITNLGNFLFGSLGGSALLGNIYDLTEWNYKGFCWSVWKFTSGSAIRGFATPDTNDSFYVVPTITTKNPAPIDFGNGTLANGFTHSFLNTPNNYITTYPSNPITMEGSDVIWESYIDSSLRASGSGSLWQGFGESFFDAKKIRICFKLSSFGKRLRKILIGLGYNFSLTDPAEVSILPLIAYYKAYWDSYAPEREKNFYSTDCWRLIQLLSDGNLQCNMTNWMADQNLGANMRLYFKRFIRDLGTLFATERMDAISASTDKVLLEASSSAQLSYSMLSEVLKDYDAVFGTSEHAGIMEPSKEGSGDNQVFGLRQASSGVNATLQQPYLDALKKAYIYQNKRSVVGKKIADILRMNGQGKYVEECQGRFIAASEEGIKISDVVATAATNEASLGQYGGRGLGVSADQFSYSTDTHGYLIMLSSVVPEAGYVNAPDLQNEVIDFAHLYNPELDGMNYEAVLKKQVAGSPLVSKHLDNSQNDTMGFLPTYSKFKFTSNKANGDFGLNSMKTSLRPYTLDKYIPVNDCSVVMTWIDSDGSINVDLAPMFDYSKLPNSGEDYRYVNKQPWNGDWNRIFKADDDGIEWQYVSENDDGYLFNSFEYDNFLVHNVFNISYWAPMKAIEDSYQTYDEDGNESKGGVSRS